MAMLLLLLQGSSNDCDNGVDGNGSNDGND